MEQVPSDFKIVSIFPVRNEEDIIEATIEKLMDEDVEVFILDNWSDDGTWEILQGMDYTNLHIERWPESGPDQYFDMIGGLKRIEEISLRYPGAWILGQGSDEILVPPWPGMSLRDALYRVEKEGYNFIEVLLHNFEPTDDDFVRGIDPEKHFDYFWIEKGHIHRRIWKQPNERVRIADNASHNINFSGRKIHLKKWIMKHYRLRSQRHGEKKMAERRARYDPEELKKGWHVHYDHIKDGHNFIKKPGDLLSFRKQYPDMIGGEKRMKEYLDADKSERAEILYNVVKDYIEEEMSILDIGVGCGVMVGFMKKDFENLDYVGIDNDPGHIKGLKKAHRKRAYTWVKGEVEDFQPDKFDIVIHTALPSLQVGGRFWRIHEILLAKEETRPFLVFLEVGEYKEGGSNTMKTFEMVKEMYLNKGYHAGESGRFHVEAEGFPIPQRHYALLRKVN